MVRRVGRWTSRTADQPPRPLATPETARLRSLVAASGGMRVSTSPVRHATGRVK